MLGDDHNYLTSWLLQKLLNFFFFFNEKAMPIGYELRGKRDEACAMCIYYGRCLCLPLWQGEVKGPEFLE